MRVPRTLVGQVVPLPPQKYPEYPDVNRVYALATTTEGAPS